MTDDQELERLKAKRLAEMQRNLASPKSESPQEPARVDRRSLLISRLGYRGMEVLQNAERQFPNQASLVVYRLGELAESGELNEELDGGQLLALFRSIGINVRMDNKIRIAKDGKTVLLSDKLGMENEHR